MASMTTPRLPFLPARTRSAVAATSSSSPSSPLPRRSIKCSSSTNANSAPLPSTSRQPRAPVADGVGSADLNGLRAPPIPVADSPLPAYRDPHGLPRPLTSADLMESSGEGLKVAYQRASLERTARLQQRRPIQIARQCPVSTLILHFRLFKTG
uniref:Uncharacterized protein n=1 Tax=Aegilops tauschii subsp. strangulata TaxID=200361 RepID=A0A453IBR6_AEGTS